MKILICLTRVISVMIFCCSCSDQTNKQDNTDYKALYIELQQKIKQKKFNSESRDSIYSYGFSNITFKTIDSSLIPFESYFPVPGEFYVYAVRNKYGHCLEMSYYKNVLRAIQLFQNHPKDPLFKGDELKYNLHLSTYNWRPDLVFEYFSDFSPQNDNLIKFGFRDPEFHFPTHIGNTLYFDMRTKLDSITLTTVARETLSILELCQERHSMWRY